jgi:hypothetical protein
MAKVEANVMFRSILILVCVPLALITVGACEQRSDDNGPDADTATILPAGLFRDTAPTDARSVVDLLRAAQDGEQVAVRGRIGGRREPFVAGRAMFTLIDLSLPSCADTPGDACPTPWDYCCEPIDRITASTVTVRVTDADGQPLRVGLDGVHGLRPLAEVIVEGRVVKPTDDAPMMIDASALHVRRAG